MIRYSGIGRPALEAAIRAERPQWLADAALRTAAFISAGRFSEQSSLWSQVKIVFMRLQHFKCVFCERAMAQEEAGKIEQDVEHYRPKNAVKPWTVPADLGHEGVIAGSGRADGYFWLAYDVLNYAAACKPCNTPRKSNHFPIGGKHGIVPQSVEALNRVERPHLIFPLIDDAEDLITFEGILAVPRHRHGPRYHRALVTIALLGLNIREELWEDRFRTIAQMISDAEVAEVGHSPARRRHAREALEDAVSERAPQAGCARAFRRLIDQDPDRAWQIYCDAKAFVTSRRGNPSAGQQAPPINAP
ncbi:MAG: hypothetical protein ACJ8DZ_10390 [Allosphingosinicella sp.]